MPLPSSGTITLAQIQAEFGGANPISLSEYYKGGAYVKATDAAPNVPTSGAISLANFHGASKNIVGQVAYTTPGTYTWVAPAGVTSVCVVCVGAGGKFDYGDSSGGSLAYGNNIPVTPGTSYTVGVGSAGEVTSVTRSYFAALSVLYADGGSNTDPTSYGGGTSITGGGIGGALGTGGGGAGGYTGKGGKGGYWSPVSPGEAGQGGGGSGGYAQSASYQYLGGGGGGVGILGQGASGAAPTAPGQGGLGGSGGANGAAGGSGGTGGNYGGGNGFRGTTGGTGSSGAVRIIWGANRAFPSTNTGNL